MNNFEAKFKKQQQTIKDYVKCFMEDSAYGNQLEELSAFFESHTSIKHVTIIQGKNIVMLVHPRRYYEASVIGAKYATAHELSMLSLVNVDGTITKDFRALLADPKSKNVLTDKMVGNIEEFGNIIPF